MKSLNHLYKCGLVLSATLFLFSCKKQIAEQQHAEKETAASMQSANTSCKPTVLGMLADIPGAYEKWETLMQKWYDSNGKLAYIKAEISSGHDISTQGEFILPWGTVTYHGNQVYVHDQGKLVLRITLNAQGKPEATYFYMQAPPNMYNQVDTSYYYYAGDRLTQMVSLRHSPPSHTSITYNFNYDAYGNIEHIESGTIPGSSINIRYIYNYSKPTNGILPYTFVSFPLKMLEYMDLLRLPMHHELTSFIRGAYQPGMPYDIFAVNHWDHDLYNYNDNNQVHSYMIRQRYFFNRFYIGWDCGGGTSSDPASRAKNEPIQSVEGFKRRFQQ